MILVSACLAGCNCRYDGGSNSCFMVSELVRQGKALPVCPEQLGGLATPRLPAEISGGSGLDVIEGKARVLDREGKDVSGNFLRGAYEVLALVRLIGCKEAILKARSPSCGVEKIYDGSFRKIIRSGDGVTAALLRRNGIAIKTEEDL